MPRRMSDEQWGPTHQHMDPPFRRGPSLGSIVAGIVGWAFLLFLLGVLRIMVGLGSDHTIAWLIGAVIVLAVCRVLLALGVVP